jgi:hypothetical protein
MRWVGDTADIPEFALVLHFIGCARRAIKHKGVCKVIPDGAPARKAKHLKNQRVV